MARSEQRQHGVKKFNLSASGVRSPAQKVDILHKKRSLRGALCAKPMLPETRLALLMGYALAVRQCRAELIATQTWLQDEVATLRKGLAAARAELDRLRAIDKQRDPDATLN